MIFENIDLCCKFNSIGVKYIQDALLSDYSTFRIGGKADYITFPSNFDELVSIINIADDEKIKYTIIGKGSNILFDDRGYGGIIINTSNMKNINISVDIMTIEAGALITSAAIEALKNSLSGLEFAYGIPGTLGGAVFMNAGAYGAEISDILLSAKVYDTLEHRIYDIDSEMMELGYRSSIFMRKSNLIVLSAVLKLKNGNEHDIKSLMKKNMNLRHEKQPLEYPNAGSVFKRTEGYFMGKIIEESGLKGYTVGGAQISEKHAGFIINKGGATSTDVLSVIEHIKSVLTKRYGINAECEIRYIEY